MVFSKKYTYKWGEEGFEKRINGYEDIDDSDDLLASGNCLIIQRIDEMEMDKDEIKKIREDLFDDPYLQYFLVSVDSIYKNKKLYFWLSDTEITYPDSEEEFLNFIRYTFELFGYANGKLIKRDIGFDLIYPDHDLTLFCIDDFDYMEIQDKERSITKEEIIDILKKSEYKNRVIILWLVELSDDAYEYAKSQNVWVNTTMGILKRRRMIEFEFNDDITKLISE